MDISLSNFQTNTTSKNSQPMLNSTTNTADPLEKLGGYTKVENNKLSINLDKIAVTRQVISQQIDISLQLNSTTQDVSPSDEYDQGFSADLTNKVINKIYDDSDSAHPNASVISAVQIQVENSFEQSTVILNELGILDNTVDGILTSTQAQIDQSINQLPSDNSALNTTITQLSATTETETYDASNAVNELTSSLELITKDGDVVTINLSLSESSSIEHYQNNDSSTLIGSSATNSQLSFEVVGNLNENEMESIEKVIERVSELTEKLFNGEIHDAMEELSELKFDPEQLAGLSLDISRNTSYEAINAYQQVSQLTIDTTSTSQIQSENSKLTSTNSAPQASTTDSTLTNESTSTNNASSVVNSTNSEADSFLTTEKPATLTLVDISSEIGSIIKDVTLTSNLKDAVSDSKKLFNQFADLFSHDTTNDVEHFIKELLNATFNKLDKENDND